MFVWYDRSPCKWSSIIPGFQHDLSLACVFYTCIPHEPFGTLGALKDEKLVLIHNV